MSCPPHKRRLCNFRADRTGTNSRLTAQQPRPGAAGCTQVVVQLGEVVTSLGDRVWATWFASGPASTSPQNVNILGTARVPLAVRRLP